MGAGIAVTFKKRFNGVEELKQQSKSDFPFTSPEGEIVSKVPKAVLVVIRMFFDQGITTKIITE